MTEKRFEYYGQGFWYDNVEDADLENKDILNSLNELYKENEQLKVHFKRILQNEYDKCDIPVWRGQYIKKLAEKLGVELNELYE